MAAEKTKQPPTPPFCLPHVRQIFETEEEAYACYNAHGSYFGFSVRKQYVHYDKETGLINDRTYVCHKEGMRKLDARRGSAKKQHSITRCNCPASMTIHINWDTRKYVVTRFYVGHNHNLHQRIMSHFHRSQRKVSAAQVAAATNALNSGLSMRATYELLGNEVGGVQNLGFLKEDMKRHLQTKRQRSMEYGEAAVVLDYFQERWKDNPAFYSSFQLDEEEQITNIFWADARMILDYADFGDVVAFDTTYKTNNCHRPLAVFAGCSHYRKTVIFGAALLYDETGDSFEWLFKTFLHCMSNKLPKTMFTDQAAAITVGLRRVMPDTKYCLCTWHLTMNLKTHYGHLMNKGIVADWHDIMHVSMSEEQFEMAWKVFTEKHDVQNDAWFLKKYEMKEQWADAFLKTTLTLGMTSTQLSERMNASLKKWLKSDVNMVRFFHQFDRVVRLRRHAEMKLEYQSRQKCFPPNIKGRPMLHHALEVYTLPMFERFRDEKDAADGLVVESQVGKEGGSLYRVARYDDSLNVFEVFRCLETQTVACSCAQYEMRGYLCSHCLKVLDIMNIKTIPNQYVLKRWTNSGRGECALDFAGLQIIAEPDLRMSHRYHSLCTNIVSLAARAAESEEATSLVAL